MLTAEENETLCRVGPETPMGNVLRRYWTPPDDIAVSEMILACNWIQVQEGSIDSSPVGILHLDTLAVSSPGPRSVGSFDFAGQPWDTDIQAPPRAGLGWPSQDNGPKIEL